MKNIHHFYYLIGVLSVELIAVLSDEFRLFGEELAIFSLFHIIRLVILFLFLLCLVLFEVRLVILIVSFLLFILYFLFRLGFIVLFVNLLRELFEAPLFCIQTLVLGFFSLHLSFLARLVFSTFLLLFSTFIKFIRFLSQFLSLSLWFI